MSQFESPEEVWLLNLGLPTDHSEQNLMFYGWISTRGVVNVELMIDAEKFHVSYAVVLEGSGWRRYRFQRWLENRGGLSGKLALLFFLRMFGSYDPASRISRCVKDYAGPKWNTTTEVLGVKQYLKVANADRAKGWFYKSGIDEGSGVRREDGTGTSSPARS